MSLIGNPFALTPAEVQALSSDELVALINQFVISRAIQCGIRIDNVRTTLRTNDPDGGIDATVDTGTLDDGFLGQGLSVWQFKKSFPSDTTTTAQKCELEEELENPTCRTSSKPVGGTRLSLANNVPRVEPTAKSESSNVWKP